MDDDAEHSIRRPSADRPGRHRRRNQDFRYSARRRPGTFLMKVSGCGKLSLSPLTGHWFRALNLKYWKSRLATNHTTIYRSRFSAATPASPLYRLLYLGENHQVAIYEVGALLGDPNSPISSPRGSWVLMSMQVRLHRIADLSDPAQQKHIATNDQEPAGVWANSPGMAPTQQLGAALYAHPGLEGFVFPSSKAGSRNLALFMDKLDGKSSVNFRNELSKKNRIPRMMVRFRERPRLLAAPSCTHQSSLANAGATCVELYATDEAAPRFYLSFGFVPLPDDQDHPVLAMAVSRRLGLRPIAG